jgi:hypothetical protein
MNIYDWKRTNIFLIIMGFAMLIAIWGYHIGFYPYIPSTLTYMLTGVCGGIMFFTTIICQLKIRDIEEWENGEI